MVEILLACATAAGAAVLAGLARQRRRAAAEVLARYARRSGLAFRPDRLRIEGHEGAVGFVIDLARFDGRVCTRVAARASRGRCLRVRLVARPFGVRAEDEDAAGAALERTSDAVGALRTRDGLWLASDGALVVCAWPGVEADAEVLDAARRVVAEVADTRPPDAPYR